MSKQVENILEEVRVGIHGPDAIPRLGIPDQNNLNLMKHKGPALSENEFDMLALAWLKRHLVDGKAGKQVILTDVVTGEQITVAAAKGAVEFRLVDNKEESSDD